jgi:hypothetical protein
VTVGGNEEKGACLSTFYGRVARGGRTPPGLVWALGACRSMPIARSKPPVPPNTSLLFGHNATALLPHRASYRRNIRLRIGQRAYSDRLLGPFHPAAAQATRADSRRDMSSAVVDSDGLQVRQPAPLGFIHRVADVISRHRSLTTHVASFGHNGGSVPCAPSRGKARPGRGSSGMQPKSANREPM